MSDYLLGKLVLLTNYNAELLYQVSLKILGGKEINSREGREQECSSWPRAVNSHLMV